MTLTEEIESIRSNGALTYEQKVERLKKLIASHEIDAVLPKPQEELPRLKEPLKPKTKGMRTLNLALKPVYFDAILKGVKKQEFRDYTEYYINKCTYTEGGKRYLVPFDALVFYQGNSRSMTVALTDIQCNGKYFIFYLGEILYPKNG